MKNLFLRRLTFLLALIFSFLQMWGETVTLTMSGETTQATTVVAASPSLSSSSDKITIGDAKGSSCTTTNWNISTRDGKYCKYNNTNYYLCHTYNNSNSKAGWKGAGATNQYVTFTIPAGYTYTISSIQYGVVSQSDDFSDGIVISVGNYNSTNITPTKLKDGGTLTALTTINNLSEALSSGTYTLNVSITGTNGNTGKYCGLVSVVLTGDLVAVTSHHVTYAKGEGTVTGTLPTQADVKEGEKFTVAGNGDLARDGYTFAGWNDGSADYAEGATYTMGTSDVTLTAQWTPVAPTKTVYLEPNGIWGSDPMYVHYWGGAAGAQWSEQMQPTSDCHIIYTTKIPLDVTGFMFVYNSTAEMPSYENNWRKTVNLSFDESQDLYTLTGFYQCNDNCEDKNKKTGEYGTYVPYHKVTFNANGHGTAPDDQCVKSGEKASAPAAPAADGFTFEGWYENAECTGSAWDFATGAITANKELFAKWEEDLTTTWYIEGTASQFGGWQTSGIRMTKKTGESTIEKYYATINVTSLPGDGEYQFQVYNSANSTDYGYNSYWITRENHSTTVYSGNPTNMQFKPDVLGEYIFAIDNTGSNPVLDVTFPSTEPVDIFKMTVTNGYTTSVNSGDSHDITSSEATINGGSALVYNGKSSAAALMGKTNINLGGSSYSYLKVTLENGETLRKDDQVILSTKNTFKLSAEADNSKTLTTESDGTYTITTLDVLAGSNVLYVWKDASGGSSFTTITISRPANSQPNQFWNVDFVGSSKEFAPMRVLDQKSITLPAATGTPNQKFLGWYDAETDGNKIGNVGDSYTPTANTTLYAHWATWQVYYRRHAEVLNNQNWKSVDFSESNTAVIPNLMINTKYDICLYDGVTYYAKADGMITHLYCSDVVLTAGSNPNILETTYSAGYTVTLSVTEGTPKISVAYPEDGPAYIFGTFTNSELRDENIFNESNNWTVDVTLDGNKTGENAYKFRLFDGGRLCTNATISASTTEPIALSYLDNSEDINKLETTVAGKYRFVYNKTNKSISIIYPQAITLDNNIEGGSVKANGVNAESSALPGDIVSLVATPRAESNYYLQSWNVRGKEDPQTPVDVTRHADGSYTFVMPAFDVEVGAVFTNTPFETTDNHYFAHADFDYQAGMSIAASDIMVTLASTGGNLVTNTGKTNWVDNRFKHVIQFSTDGGNNNTGAPSGSYCSFAPTANGKLTVALYLPKWKEFYVKNGTTRMTPTTGDRSATEFSYEFPDENEISQVLSDDERNPYELNAESYGTITFDVTAGQTYYVFCAGAAIGLQGFIFSPDVKTISGANYYNTFYDSNNGYELPAGVNAYAVIANATNATAQFVKVCSGDEAENNILPHDCAVILCPTSELTENGTKENVFFNLKYSYTKNDGQAINPSKPDNNNLHGTDITKTTPVVEGCSKYYKLSYAANNESGTIGFYWGAEGGAVFTNAKHKAYLALPNLPQGQSAPNRFTIVMPGEFGPGISTGVEEMSNFQSRKVLVGGKLYIVRENKVFDLNGRLVK